MRAALLSLLLFPQTRAQLSPSTDDYYMASSGNSTDDYYMASSGNVETCYYDFTPSSIAPDIVCPYGTFVTQFIVWVDSFVQDINVYCSDGSFAGNYGGFSYSTQYSVSSSSGFTQMTGYSDSAYMYQLRINNDVFGGQGSFPLQEWSCSCGSNQLVRGLLRPTIDVDDPTGFKLFCDSPCPQGTYGVNSPGYTLVTDGPIIDYGGECVSYTPNMTPSRAPTMTPSTRAPTKTPSQAPTMTPSTRAPTMTPSRAPTMTPSRAPTMTPSTDYYMASSGNVETCYYDFTPSSIAPDIVCPYGTFVTQFIVWVDTFVQDINVYCSDGSFAGNYGGFSYTTQYSVSSSSGFTQMTGQSDSAYMYQLRINNDVFGGQAGSFPLQEWSCSCGSNQLVRGLLRPTIDVDDPTGFKLFCDSPCPQGTHGVNSPGYTLVTDGPIIDYGGECVSYTPTKTPSRARSVAPGPSVMPTRALDFFIVRPGVEVACNAIVPSADLRIEPDIMCPFGSFVSRLSIGVRMSRIEEISVVCSDGTYAGTLGSSSSTLSYFYVETRSGLDRLRGTAGYVSYFGGASGGTSYLKALIVDGSGVYGDSSYANGDVSWSCGCAQGQVMRGMRSPTVRVIPNSPYSFQLYCDTPCPSGYYGRGQQGNGTSADYPGKCFSCPSQTSAGQTSCNTAGPTASPNGNKISSVNSTDSAPPVGIIVIVAIFAFFLIIALIWLKCYCCVRDAPTPPPSALYIAATSQAGPATPSAPPLYVELEDAANERRV